MNPLHHHSNDAQATGLRRKSVNLIDAQSDIAEQTFDGIRAANRPMHHLHKGIKGQEEGSIDRVWPQIMTTYARIINLK